MRGGASRRVAAGPGWGHQEPKGRTQMSVLGSQPVVGAGEFR